MIKTVIKKNMACNYVSCIKINGKPILPPLITPEKSKKLLKYKEQAIQIEKDIKLAKDVDFYMESYLTEDLEVLGQTDCNKSLEQRLSFDHFYDAETDNNSEIIDLDTSVAEMPSSELINTLQFEQISDTKALMLTNCNIYSFQQENNDNCDSNSSSTVINLEKYGVTECSIEHLGQISHEQYTPTTSKENEKNNECIKPQLIRSNSYVLESPSPVLLQHLQRRAAAESAQMDTAYNGEIQTEDESIWSEKQNLCDFLSRYNSEINNCEENSESQKINVNENTLQVTVSPNNTTPHRTDMNENIPQVSVSPKIITVTDEKHCRVDEKENNFNLLSNIVQKIDREIGNIYNNNNTKGDDHAVDINHSKCTNSSGNSPNKNILFMSNNAPTSYVNSESDWKQMHNKCESYPEDIVEFLQKNFLRQQNRLKAYSKLKDLLIMQTKNEKEFELTQKLSCSDSLNTSASVLTESYCNTMAVLNEKNHCTPRRENECNESIVSSETLHYSMSSPTNTSTPSPSNLLNDFNYDSCVNKPELETNALLCKENESEVLPFFDACSDFPTSHCIKEMLPEQRRLKQVEHAATVLGAAAKGYLVRRLMHTERVQGLIQTIKDALICAMQLHAEDTTKIQPSEVEFHRRLIQQVSAACYAFHDVFFSLKISEQMAIISTDRLRLKQKLKRPSTAGSRLSSSKKADITPRSPIVKQKKNAA